jgi:hypothetical protein
MISYPITVCITIALHVIWAVSLVIDPTAINATGLRTMLLVARDTDMAAAIFAAVAVAATVGLISKGRFLRVLLILPQQAVLWFSVMGAINAMWLGQFADGVQRSHWFLIVDQMPVVLIALGHTLALLLIADRVND